MKYTQERYDAMPIVDGYKQCPSGDYTAVREFGERSRFGEQPSFGAWSSFGERSRFGERSSFGARSRFGADCLFEGSHKALRGYPLMTLGGCGSVNRTVYAFNVNGGPIIRAGCFVASLDEFRAKVREDGDRLTLLQYIGWANIVAATWCPERIEA